MRKDLQFIDNILYIMYRLVFKQINLIEVPFALSLYPFVHN